MNCKKYCKGGINTKDGLVADGLDLSIFREKSYVKKTFKWLPKGVACPHGCKANPKTKEATQNAVKNSGIGFVCLQNPWVEEAESM